MISTAKKTGVTGYCLQSPSAAHYYQARITKNYTIKHYRVDYYEYGVKKRTFYQDMYEQVSEDSISCLRLISSHIEGNHREHDA